MDGAILVVSALDGPMPFDDPGRSLRLVAKGTPAQASCADANGDDKPGVVQVAADFQDTGSGDRVRVVLETLPGQDVDKPGTYPLTLSIGDERWKLDARVALGPARQRRKRRRSRKRGKR
ncbi:MAG: hypothetical protein ACRDJC_20375 [Thermomicrobiales bacterium]